MVVEGGQQAGTGVHRRTLSASTLRDETPLRRARWIAFSYSARSFTMRSFSLRSSIISFSSWSGFELLELF